MSALAATRIAREPAPRLPRGAAPRPLRHLARAARVPRAGDPAAALPALRLRQGARQPRLHAARLRQPALPGLVALTAVITGMQTLAFPLVAEFGWTREIEDRLLAPMPTALRRRREGRLRHAARARRRADHDPDRHPDPRLDPVALERPAALRRGPRARRARRRRLRARARHARPAAADQPRSSRSSSRRSSSPAAASTRGPRSPACAGSRW